MLVRRLQVEHRIAWIPEMRREDLHQYYAGATAVFGQFGTPVLTGVALEPLAWATPSISYFSDLTFGVPYYDVLPPIVNAETVEELVAAMVLIFGSEEAKGYLSNAGWEWVRINCSEDRFVDRAQQTLDACAGETT
jgi:hypothetical protein